MKKLKFGVALLAALVSLLLVSFTTNKVFAGGGNQTDAPDTISATATTASVGESVTLTVYGYYDDAKNGAPLNGGPQLPIFILITSGNGSLSPSRVTPGYNGIATFNLSATNAGSVTVEGCTDFSETPGYIGSEPTCPDASPPVTVTFNAPAPKPVTHVVTPSSATSTESIAPATPKSNSITVPPNLGLTFWNGVNFGQSGQTLAPSSSAAAQVGIANKSNVPLAVVTVNLSAAQDWSKSNIVYGTDNSAHKAFVHGLTTAPGVVGGTFTLYVPYAGNDSFVGVCPGASSLNLVGPGCPNLYYVANGQKLTSSSNNSIPKNDTVTASITTVNNVKYWQVSGLTGTGGFSSANNHKLAVVKPTATITRNTSNHTASYVIGAVVLAVLLALGGTTKWWLPRLRKVKAAQPAVVAPRAGESDPSPNTSDDDHSAGGDPPSNTNL